LWSVRPKAFKIERRENKVFIPAAGGNVGTNLFIWTASTRPNYELIPAINDAGQMDFAIDYRSPQPQASVTKKPEATEADKRLPNELFIRSAIENRSEGMVQRRRSHRQLADRCDDKKGTPGAVVNPVEGAQHPVDSGGLGRTHRDAD
jgi:hypothetical protein